MSRRILIAEDERPIRELLQALLSDEGYQVTAVCDGQEGLEALANATYDLVLSNVRCRAWTVASWPTRCAPILPSRLFRLY